MIGVIREWIGFGIEPEIKRAERRLPQLKRTLERPIDGLTKEQITVLAFGDRGWSLYTGARHAMAGNKLDSAQVDLRALLDLLIMARWIEDDPTLRVQLWRAEDARLQLPLAAGLDALNQRRGSPESAVFTPAEIAALRAEVAAARAAGTNAGLPVGGASLLPSGQQMAQGIPEMEEAYEVGYRVLSASVHASGRSFVNAEIVVRKGKRYLVHKPAFKSDVLRSLAVPMVCLLLATVSRQVGLGIETECDRLRVAAIQAGRP